MVDCTCRIAPFPPTSERVGASLLSGSAVTTSALSLNIARPALVEDQQSGPGYGETDHAGPPPQPFGTPYSGRERSPSRRSSPPSREAWSATSARPHLAEPECGRSWPGCTPAHEAGDGPRWPSSSGTTGVSTSRHSCPLGSTAPPYRADCRTPPPAQADGTGWSPESPLGDRVR